MKMKNYGVIPDKELADNYYIHSNGKDNFPSIINTPCILIGLFNEQGFGESFIEITAKEIRELINL